MERTEDTDDEVDFLPRKPADERRMVERGVKGTGDTDCRLYEDDVATLGRKGCTLDGVVNDEDS